MSLERGDSFTPRVIKPGSTHQLPHRRRPQTPGEGAGPRTMVGLFHFMQHAPEGGISRSFASRSFHGLVRFAIRQTQPGEMYLYYPKLIVYPPLEDRPPGRIDYSEYGVQAYSIGELCEAIDDHFHESPAKYQRSRLNHDLGQNVSTETIRYWSVIANHYSRPQPLPSA